MAKAHMTKLHWYETEMDKLIAVGYAPGEAHRILMDWYDKMGAIEWTEEVQDV